MSQVRGKDVVSGVERSDKALRNKLLDLNFARYDDKSRPATEAYREGWERCFGKKEGRDSVVNFPTQGEQPAEE